MLLHSFMYPHHYLHLFIKHLYDEDPIYFTSISILVQYGSHINK